MYNVLPRSAVCWVINPINYSKNFHKPYSYSTYRLGAPLCTTCGYVNIL